MGVMITEKGVKHLEACEAQNVAVWTTEDGLKIRITHMSSEHLVNAINWLITEQTKTQKDAFSDLTDQYQGVMLGTWVKTLSQELYNRIPK